MLENTVVSTVIAHPNIQQNHQNTDQSFPLEMGIKLFVMGETVTEVMCKLIHCGVRSMRAGYVHPIRLAEIQSIAHRSESLILIFLSSYIAHYAGLGGMVCFIFGASAYWGIKLFQFNEDALL